MNKQKFCKIHPFKFKVRDKYFSGFNLKRDLTFGECKYILSSLLGVVVEDREMYEDSEGYQEYKDEITNTVNDWLNGMLDDTAIQELSYDCSDEPLGLFNSLNIVMYLQKKGLI